MKWFKLKKAEHVATNADFLEGQWAAKSPGRWNKRHTPVIYAGDSLETVVAECGLWWILTGASDYDRGLSASRRPPNAWSDVIESLGQIDALIAELEVDPFSAKLDLTEESVALQEFEKRGLSVKDYSEILRNFGSMRANSKTKFFGQKIKEEGIQQLIVRSARRADGVCSVFYSDNIGLQSIRVKSVEPVKLFGLYKNGARITGKIDRLDVESFEFEYRGSTAICKSTKL